MTKRTVYIRNARIVPAETVWPGRSDPDDMVLRGELASPMLGGIVGHAVRTSLIVEQRLSMRQVETQNTIYELVS